MCVWRYNSIATRISSEALRPVFRAFSMHQMNRIIPLGSIRQSCVLARHSPFDWHGSVIEEWRIDDRDCLEYTNRLWALGFPVGPCSGLDYAASLAVLKRLGPDANVVTVFPDRMERYFSHKVFADLRDAHFWHFGHQYVERWPNTAWRIGVPQMRQGSPLRS
jgi:hypothetical protein